MAEDVNKPEIIRIYFKPGKNQHHWDVRSTGKVFEVVKAYTEPAKHANPGDTMVSYGGHDLRGKSYNYYITLRTQKQEQNSADSVLEVWFLRKGSPDTILSKKEVKRVRILKTK